MLRVSPGFLRYSVQGLSILMCRLDSFLAEPDGR